jgi:hypothetical protein
VVPPYIGGASCAFEQILLLLLPGVVAPRNLCRAYGTDPFKPDLWSVDKVNSCSLEALPTRRSQQRSSFHVGPCVGGVISQTRSLLFAILEFSGSDWALTFKCSLRAYRYPSSTATLENPFWAICDCRTILTPVKSSNPTRPTAKPSQNFKHEHLYSIQEWTQVQLTSSYSSTSWLQGNLHPWQLYGPSFHCHQWNRGFNHSRSLQKRHSGDSSGGIGQEISHLVLNRHAPCWWH